MHKTILTFYCDDTNPYVAPPEAYKTFLDFIKAEGIAGEASMILGFQWQDQGLISRPTSSIQQDFIQQVQRAYQCGVDTHFELFTHNGLYDFTKNRVPDGIIHEGLWMFEPAVSVQEYETYFSHILAEGEQIGVLYSGVTWPGCGCDACTRRYTELREAGLTEPNPNVWQALLNLAKRGKFHGRTVPCFIGGAESGIAHLMAYDGSYGVFDLEANAEDHFGKWFNSAEYVDADYYITSDGQAGRIIDLVRNEAPYCLFYCHWQGLNPGNGVGWEAFTQVVRRVQKHLKEQVTWMRPSELTDSLLLENKPA